VRGLFLAGHDADFDLFEANAFQPSMQIAFRKAEPMIAIEFSSLGEVVLKQVQNHNLPTRPQDPMTRRDGLVRFLRVMQRLTEHHQID
jgi:hypothetical protein